MLREPHPADADGNARRQDRTRARPTFAAIMTANVRRRAERAHRPTLPSPPRHPAPSLDAAVDVRQRTPRRVAAEGRGATVRGTAAALAALFGVGSSLALLETIDDYPAAGGQAVRYALGAALLALLLRGRLPRVTRRQLGRLALLAATGLAGFNLLVIAAERSMDPASVGVVIATVPIVLAIAAPLQEGRRVQLRMLLAAAVVALGAAAVQGVGGEVTTAGLTAALGALLGEAAFSLVAAPLLPALGATGVSAWCTALAAPQLLLYALVVDGPADALRVPELDEALVLVYLGAIVTAGCFVLWYTGVRLLGVERVGLLTGAMPAGALLTGAALGHAALSPGRLAGVLAVGLGIAAGMRAARR